MARTLNSKIAVIGFMIVALIAGLAQSGCTGGNISSSTGNTSSTSGGAPASTSGVSNSDDIVVLDAEGVYEVFLDYNAGTGFEWQCRVDPEGAFFIASQDTIDQAEDSDEPITGGPLQDIVMVRAAQPGKATLICELVRPWEEGVEPTETQTFTFEVEPSLRMHFLADESSYLIEPEEAFNS